MFLPGKLVSKHNMASDQGLHCVLTGFPSMIEQKQNNRPDTPKKTNRFVQHITVELNLK